MKGGGGGVKWREGLKWECLLLQDVRQQNIFCKSCLIGKSCWVSWSVTTVITLTIFPTETKLAEDRTNSSSLGNQFALERGGKGESMEQVLFGKNLGTNFDKSSANFPPRITIRWLNINFSSGRVAFEKLTDLDYKGETYYTIRCLLNHDPDDQSSSWSWQWPIMMKCSRNLSLYECQGWCREEPECQAASFRWQNHLHRQIKSSPTSCLLFTWHNNYLYTNFQRDKVIFTETIIIQIFFWFFLQLFSFVVNPLTPRQETICLLQVNEKQ